MAKLYKQVTISKYLKQKSSYGTGPEDLEIYAKTHFLGNSGNKNVQQNENQIQVNCLEQGTASKQGSEDKIQTHAKESQLRSRTDIANSQADSFCMTLVLWSSLTVFCFVLFVFLILKSYHKS